MASRLRFLSCLALAAAAGALLWQWSRVWQLSPDSGFSWLGLILLPYFILLRRRDCPSPQPSRLNPAWWPMVFLGGGLSALARLLLEPFPSWPLVNWVYTAAIVGLSILIIRVWLGERVARHFAFPLWFALALLPWPTIVDAVWIPHLRIMLAAVAAEVCNLAGEPAVARGTVIQIGGASIGIEEACGGIRSLQLAVMVALAAGELRRDRWPERCKWMLAAIGLALVGNGLRLVALTWIYGKFGARVFALWHDRLDWLELAFLLCGLGVLFGAMKRPPAPAPRAELAPGARAAGFPASPILAAVVLAILACSEASARLWYRSPVSESASATWNARLARESPGYLDDAFTPTMQSLLGCDAHQLGHWSDPMGARRAGYVIEWSRGQSARFAIILHNPDICLPLSGSKLVGVRPDVSVRSGALALPFACHVFSDDRGLFYVYYLAWNVTAAKPFGLSGEPTAEGESWWHSQWREVAAHRRSIAVRVMAVAIFDAANGVQADRAFQNEAARILRAGGPD